MAGANFPLFLLAAIIIAAVPGPGIFYVAARTLSGGGKTGIASTFGTALGGLPAAFDSALETGLRTFHGRLRNFTGADAAAGDRLTQRPRMHPPCRVIELDFLRRALGLMGVLKNREAGGAGT